MDAHSGVHQKYSTVITTSEKRLVRLCCSKALQIEKQDRTSSINARMDGGRGGLQGGGVQLAVQVGSAGCSLRLFALAAQPPSASTYLCRRLADHLLKPGTWQDHYSRKLFQYLRKGRLFQIWLKNRRILTELYSAPLLLAITHIILILCSNAMKVRLSEKVNQLLNRP